MRRLLILDLDETLFHTRHHPLRTFPFWQQNRAENKYAKHLDSLPPDATLEDSNFRYACYKRPGLEEFVKALMALPLDLAIWTSSTEDYAHHFISQIFPKSFQSRLVFVWSRRHCQLEKSFWLRQRSYLKDLDQLGRQFPEYRLDQIICVDDAPQKFRKHPTNLLAIEPWFGDLRDQALPILLDYLTHLPDVGDLRPWNKKNWQRSS